MKKFLSLVLALAMTMSLVTVSAGAKDFTDADKISYNEAVDVMTAIGIVDGDTAGNFNPTAGLTRGAAAKIICNLILGPTTAAELNADTDPYIDVDKNSTFAGFIAFCQKENIISGYADGTFRPTAPLTGYAFMKMLLGALGYDGAVEGYTGSNWSINVAKQALNIGLNSGLKGDFNGSAYVTREEAMLYAFNMLQADLVEYNATLGVNNGVLVTDKGTAKAMTWANSSVKKNNIKQDDYIQFAELYFNKLVKDTGDEAFLRPSTTWTWKGVEVGTYADDADVIYYGDVKLGEIYKDLGLTAKADAVVNINGIENASFKIEKNDNDKLTKVSDKLDATVGNGTIVEVYLDTDTNNVTICVISVYAAKVTSAKDATSKNDAYVVVDFGKTPAGTTITKNDNKFDTADFAEDDVVAITYSEKADEIKTMEKLESVTGALDRYTLESNMTLAGTTYKYAKEYAFDDMKETSLANKSEYVVYTDANGYALWIEESEFAIENYALVMNITDQAGWSGGNAAKLLFTDGTKKTVDLDKDYVNLTTGTDKDKALGTACKALEDNSGATANMFIVAFTVKDNGDYKLTLPDNTQNKVTMAINNHDVTGFAKGTQFDSKTVFVVNTDDDDYKVYTGIKNTPTVASATAFTYTRDNVSKVVFSVGGTVTNASKDVTFIAAASATKVVKQNDTAEYYLYNAVVAGEIQTIKLAAGVKFNKQLAGFDKATENTLFNVTKADVDDILTSGTEWDDTGAVKMGTATGVKKVSADEIKLGNVIMSVDKNVNVYYVDEDGKITELAGADDVTTDANDLVWYTKEDGDVTNIFIQEVADNNDKKDELSDEVVVKSVAIGTTTDIYYFVESGAYTLTYSDVKAILADAGCTSISVSGANDSDQWSFTYDGMPYNGVTVNTHQAFTVTLKEDDANVSITSNTKVLVVGGTEVTVELTNASDWNYKGTDKYTVTADGFTVKSVVTDGAVMTVTMTADDDLSADTKVTLTWQAKS